MDKNDFNGFPNYQNYQFEMNDQDPFFNPMLQYEQGYMYYRYLSQQMDYKIKCKEYEKICTIPRNDRKIE